MTFGLKHKAYVVVALMMLAVVASSMMLGQSYSGAERGRVYDARRRGVDDTAADLEHLLTRGLDRLRTVAALPALAYGLQLQEQVREERQIPAWTTLHYLFFESDIFTGGVVLLNRNGRIIWSEPSDISRLDTPYAAWPRVQAGLARAAADDHAFVVERGGGADEMLVAVALFDQEQERVGVLVGAIPVTNAAVVQALTRGRPSAAGGAHLVNDAGVIVASTAEQQRGQRLGYWRPPAAPEAATVMTRQAGDDELLAAMAPVPVAGWHVVTEERAADALADVRALSVTLWVGRVVFTGIMAGVLLFVVVSFTRPVEQLTRAAQRIRAGDLGSEFKLDRTDELGVLAGALNDMTLNLRHQAAELERTGVLAEAASRAKTEFLAKVSHEIRTPMNGVLGMTELLLGTSLSSTQRQFATTIQRSANSLLSLINDILDFSKIEAGKVELERVVFNVADAVNDVLSLLRESAESKRLALAAEFPPGARRAVWGDVVRVRQVLTNLTANAIKFTAAGHVTVRVVCVEESETHCTMRLEVQDTGIGIDAVNRERVFEPFVQHDSSTTRLYGGTGLGLAITRELTEQMQGTCGVESEPGKGSTFWVQLPFEWGPAEAVGITAIASSDSAATVAQERLPEGLGLRILLVEDNPVNTMLAKAMLRNLGCKVQNATNGVQALEVLDGESFDVVLMDLQMPVMGGEDAAREIRRRESGLARVPVIALTASALPGDYENCLQAGMDDLLTKPYTQAQLRKVIEQWAPARTA